MTKLEEKQALFWLLKTDSPHLMTPFGTRNSVTKCCAHEGEDHVTAPGLTAVLLRSLSKSPLVIRSDTSCDYTAMDFAVWKPAAQVTNGYHVISGH